MTLAELATFIGTAVGAAVASFAAAWWTAIRPMKNKIQQFEEQASAPIRLPDVQQHPGRKDSGKTSTLIIEVASLKDRVERLEDGYHKQQDAMGKLQTIEEFQAYTNFTSSALHQLAEKVGEVRGQLMGGKKGGR